MTRDVKIGLLLGLAFIFMIAFVINGLPSFFDRGGSDEVINTSVTNFSGNRIGLGQQANKAVKAIGVMEDSGPARRPDRVSGDYEDVRFTRELPKKVKPVRKQPSRPAVQRGKRIYVVKTDDNLGLIAKKVYGPERGNKNAVVKAIFTANRHILASPHSLNVGQELTIPAFLSIQKKQSEKKVIPASGVLEKVRSAARKNFSAIKDAVKSSAKSKPGKYVVRDGDSLWTIAEECLGNGSRYYEIVKLNKDIIYDPEDIAVGVCLKLPGG